jgi:hypothetical protein
MVRISNIKIEIEKFTNLEEERMAIKNLILSKLIYNP